ncbi:TRAP transporter small permease [Wukongibacter sp. M2B1]|uniref:TRAP transporter small permease n=1 Tax=Wukongibacter sp. M2B1 TaxID=3088895 RepID=UPI003D7B8247
MGSLVFTVCIILLQVIMRYVFNSSLSWSEELARYIFIWQIWLGASLGVREKKHIRVELVYGLFRQKGQLVMDVLSTIIWIALCIFLAINGTELTLALLQRHSTSPAMKIPMYIIYSTLPISCGVMVLRLVQRVLEIIKTPFKGEGGEV